MGEACRVGVLVGPAAALVGGQEQQTMGGQDNGRRERERQG